MSLLLVFLAGAIVGAIALLLLVCAHGVASHNLYTD